MDAQERIEAAEAALDEQRLERAQALADIAMAQALADIAKSLARIAAAVVSLLGEGATIRRGHRLILWTEGKDGWAGESYDETAETALARLNEWSNHPAE